MLVYWDTDMMFNFFVYLVNNAKLIVACFIYVLQILLHAKMCMWFTGLNLYTDQCRNANSGRVGRCWGEYGLGGVLGVLPQTFLNKVRRCNFLQFFVF